VKREKSRRGNPVIKFFTYSYGIASLFNYPLDNFTPRNDSKNNASLSEMISGNNY
jgi:hypothetical protein